MTGRPLAGTGVPGLGRVVVWFNDPSNYWGPDGLLARLREHLVYTGVFLAVAVLIGLPLGLWIGHTGRGVVVVVGTANALRAVPALGAVLLLVGWLSPAIHSQAAIPGVTVSGSLPYFLPAAIVLVVLALPPILTNTYAGMQNVDPAVRDAAAGMGMTGAQVVRRVELPCALPLILSGLRSATLQLVATIAVAAYVPLLGGLGRFIKDGVGSFNDPKYGYPAMVAAGLTVAVLAVLLDGFWALVQRLVVSPGISGRFATDRPAAADAADPALEAQLTPA